ncbi:MAG TPA: protein kinase [Kineosporiaceae bacterium]|nr:protein kinase [Kineosporiaceae bacterium]
MLFVDAQNNSMDAGGYLDTAADVQYLRLDDLAMPREVADFVEVPDQYTELIAAAPSRTRLADTGTAPDQHAPDQSNHAAPGEWVLERAAPGQYNHTVPGQPAPDRPAPERTAPDRPAPDRTAPERTALEPLVSEGLVSGGGRAGVVVGGVPPQVLRLEREWRIGRRLGGGGLGQVYEATSPDGTAAAVKLVKKIPGAERELLFVDLPGVRNVISVIDSGETADSWVIVMPKAQGSLRDRLNADWGGLPLTDAVKALTDVAETLEDLQGSIAHRDLKPENVLYLDGKWCLADFGISRYAEATTAFQTFKGALTMAYAAPERWRNERATSAADIYALAVSGYELLTGDLPFDSLNLKYHHLNSPPPDLPTTVPKPLAAVLRQGMAKNPAARPDATAMLTVLRQFGQGAHAPRTTQPTPTRSAQVYRPDNGQSSRQDAAGLGEDAADAYDMSSVTRAQPAPRASAGARGVAARSGHPQRAQEQRVASHDHSVQHRSAVVEKKVAGGSTSTPQNQLPASEPAMPGDRDSSGMNSSWLNQIAGGASRLGRGWAGPRWWDRSRQDWGAVNGESEVDRASVEVAGWLSGTSVEVAAEIADSISRPSARSRALASVAETLWATDARRAKELLDDAEAAALSMTEPTAKAWTLAAVAATVPVSKARVAARLLAEAKTAAAEISDRTARARTSTMIADVMSQSDPTRAGRMLARAESRAARLSDGQSKALTLTGIAATVTKTMADSADTRGRAQGLLFEAADLAAAVTDPVSKAVTLTAVAQALGEADPGLTNKLLTEASEIAADLSDESSRARVLTGIAEATLRIDPTGAQALYEEVTDIAWGSRDPAAKVGMLTELAASLAASGFRLADEALLEAEETLPKVGDPLVRADLQAAMARTVAVSDPARARGLLSEAVTIRRTVSVPGRESSEPVTHVTHSDLASSVRADPPSLRPPGRTGPSSSASGRSQRQPEPEVPRPDRGVDGQGPTGSGKLAQETALEERQQRSELSWWDRSRQDWGAIAGESEISRASVEVARWTAATRPESAVQFAGTIAEPSARARALASVAATMMVTDPEQAGVLVGQAETAAMGITDPTAKAWSLTAVAGTITDSRRSIRLLGQAEEVAGSIVDANAKARTLTAIAATMPVNRAGRVEDLLAQAVSIASDLPSGVSKALTVTGIAATIAMTAPSTFANRIRVGQLLSKAVSIASGLPTGAARAQTLAAVAQVMSNADARRASTLRDEATRIARGLPDGVSKVYTLASIAEAVQDVDSGSAETLYQRAADIAFEIEDVPTKVRVLSEVAGVVAGVNPELSALALSEAVNGAAGIGDLWTKADLLAVVAQASVSSDAGRATQLLAEAVETRTTASVEGGGWVGGRWDAQEAQSETEGTWWTPEEQAWGGFADEDQSALASLEVARSVAASDPDQAAGLARAIPASTAKVRALAAVATAMTVTDSRRASDLLGEAETAAADISAAAAKAHALTVIASGMTDVRRSARLLAAAENAAGNISDGTARARTLSVIATALRATNPRRSGQLLAEASRLASRLPSGPSKVWTLAGIAATMGTDTGTHQNQVTALLSEAARVASTLPYGSSKARALAGVSMVMSLREASRAAALRDEAAKIAASLPVGRSKAQALTTVAQAMRTVDPARARTLYDQAADMMWSIAEPTAKVGALTELARSLAATSPGLANQALSEAEHTARSVDEPAARGALLAMIARTVAEDDLGRARELLAEAVTVGKEALAAGGGAAAGRSEGAVTDRGSRATSHRRSGQGRDVGGRDGDAPCYARTVRVGMSVLEEAEVPWWERSVQGWGSIAEEAEVSKASVEVSRVTTTQTDREDIVDGISEKTAKARGLAVVASMGTSADREQAAERIAEARSLAAAISDPMARAWTLTEMAATLMSSDPNGARRMLAEAGQAATDISNRTGQARTLTVIARTMARSNARRASGLVSQASDIAATLPDGPSKAWTLAGIAHVMTALNQPRASQMVSEAARVSSVIGNRLSKARALSAVAQAMEGIDPDRSMRLLTEAERISASVSDGPSKAQAYMELGLALEASNPHRADALYGKATTIALNIGDHASRAWCLTELARTVAATDQVRGGQLLSEAQQGASLVSDQQSKADLLAAVAQTMAVLDPARASQVLTDAVLAEARAVPVEGASDVRSGHVDDGRQSQVSSQRRSQNWGVVAVEVGRTAATDPARAEALANAIVDTAWKGYALLTIAGTVTAADPARARRLLAYANTLVDTGTELPAFPRSADRGKAVATPSVGVRGSVPSGAATPSVGVRGSVPSGAATPSVGVRGSVPSGVATPSVGHATPPRDGTGQRSQADAPGFVWPTAVTNPSDAEKVARSVADDTERAWALVSAVATMASTDAARAESIAREIRPDSARAMALASVAQALVAADPERAWDLFEEAEYSARAVSDKASQAWTLRALGTTMAVTHPEEAVQLIADAERIEPTGTDPVVAVVVTAAASDPERATTVARTIPDSPVSKAWALVAVAAAVATTDRARTVALIDEARTVAGIEDTPLSQTVRAAAATDPVGTARFVRSIADATSRAWTQVEMAKALAGSAPSRAAELLTDALKDRPTRTADAGRAPASSARPRSESGRPAAAATGIPAPSGSSSGRRPGAEQGASAGADQGAAGREPRRRGESADPQVTMARARSLAATAPGEAADLVRDLPDAEQRALALTQVAEAAAPSDPVVAASLWTEAERTARKIVNGGSHARSLATVAQSMVSSDPGRAESIVYSLLDPTHRTAALLGLVEKITNTEPELAAHLLKEAEGAARKIGDEARRTWMQGMVGRAMTASNLVDTIRETDEDRWDPTSDEDVKALHQQVESLAATDPAKAEQIARTIQSPSWRTSALAQIAKTVAPTNAAYASRLFTQAERIARSIQDERARSRELYRVSRLAAPSDRARAESIIHGISHMGIRAASLGVLAQEVMESHPGEASRLATQCEVIARNITNEDERAKVLAWAKTVKRGAARTVERSEEFSSTWALMRDAWQAGAGDPRQVAQLLDKAETSVRGIGDLSTRVWTLTVLSQIAAASNQARGARLLTEAARVARGLPEDGGREFALAAVAQATRGEDVMGTQWPRPLTEPVRRDASGSAVAGTPGRAKRRTSWSDDAAVGNWETVGAAARMVAATDPDMAERIATAIDDETGRSWALTEVALTLAGTDLDRAVDVTKNIPDELARVNALEQLGDAAAATSASQATTLYAEADRVARSYLRTMAADSPEAAAELARTVPDETTRAWALVEVAGATAEQDTRLAERLISEAQSMVGVQEDPVSEMARAVTAAAPEKAESIARRISDNVARAWALVAVAKMMLADDQAGAARLLTDAADTQARVVLDGEPASRSRWRSSYDAAYEKVSAWTTEQAPMAAAEEMFSGWDRPEPDAAPAGKSGKVVRPHRSAEWYSYKAKAKPVGDAAGTSGADTRPVFTTNVIRPKPRGIETGHGVTPAPVLTEEERQLQTEVDTLAQERDRGLNRTQSQRILGATANRTLQAEEARTRKENPLVKWSSVRSEVGTERTRTPQKTSWFKRLEGMLAPGRSPHRSSRWREPIGLRGGEGSGEGNRGEESGRHQGSGSSGGFTTRPGWSRRDYEWKG